MDSLDNITTVVQPSFTNKTVEHEIDINDIIKFCESENEDNNTSFVAGRVYQKNKKLDTVDTFFKILEESVTNIESKNNKDMDNSFFNLNKKILSNNLYNIKEILKMYDMNEQRLVHFLLGTLIQYKYESKK